VGDRREDVDRFLIVSRERQLHLRQANDVAEKRGIAYRIGTGGGGDADLDELEVGLAMGTTHGCLIGQGQTEFLAAQRTDAKVNDGRPEVL